jgi:hypothetical protein
MPAGRAAHSGDRRPCSPAATARGLRRPFSHVWHTRRVSKRAPLLLLSLALLAACSQGTGTSGGGSSSSPSPQAASSSPAAGPQVETNPPGDIPDTQVFVDFKPAAGGFHLKVPEGWSQVQDGSAYVFTDKYNSIRVESISAAAAPTADSVRQGEVPQIQARTAHFSLGPITTVSRKSGMAILVKYTGDSPVNPVTGKVAHEDYERYDFWKAGTEVAVTLASPVGSDNVDPWKVVTDSFAWQ